ncbi:MAG: hypothetical protein WAO21_09915 [Verrucomicrobiia bacterium]
MNEPRTSAAFSVMWPNLLALRADAEKLKFVADGLEFVFGGNAPLNFFGKAFVNLDNFRAFRANQMMVMAVVALADQFKARRTVAEIKPLDHAHVFEHVHGPVNCRQITKTFWQGSKNLTAGERVRMRAQDIQDRLPGAGDFVRLSAQAAGQRG